MNKCYLCGQPTDYKYCKSCYDYLNFEINTYYI